VSLANNVEFLRRLPKLNGFNAFGEFGKNLRSSLDSPLAETTGFGTNPGALRMFAFAPENLQHGAALVVVLHGCGQTAAGYDLGAGWSTLAKRYGFALLMPEQQPSNNAQGCFNWFNPEDTSRERGEACSIRQMIARMAGDYKVDPHRIFVTGLSAGGAMTSVMLATYPEVFAGGAIIAGLPFGVATNVREALNGMYQSPSRPAGELGDLVRKASGHKGPWPKISVWHGSADRTGFGGLEAIDTVTMVTVPDLMAAYQQGMIDLEGVQAVQLAMIAHCELMADRVAIIDPPPDMSPQAILNWRKSSWGLTRKTITTR